MSVVFGLQVSFVVCFVLSQLVVSAGTVGLCFLLQWLLCCPTWLLAQMIHSRLQLLSGATTCTSHTIHQDDQSTKKMSTQLRQPPKLATCPPHALQSWSGKTKVTLMCLVSPGNATQATQFQSHLDACHAIDMPVTLWGTSLASISALTMTIHNHWIPDWGKVLVELINPLTTTLAWTHAIFGVLLKHGLRHQ